MINALLPAHIHRQSDERLKALIDHCERSLLDGTSTHGDMVTLIECEREIIKREHEKVSRTIAGLRPPEAAQPKPPVPKTVVPELTDALLSSDPLPPSQGAQARAKRRGATLQPKYQQLKRPQSGHSQSERSQTKKRPSAEPKQRSVDKAVSKASKPAPKATTKTSATPKPSKAGAKLGRTGADPRPLKSRTRTRQQPLPTKAEHKAQQAPAKPKVKVPSRGPGERPTPLAEITVGRPKVAAKGKVYKTQTGRPARRVKP